MALTLRQLHAALTLRVAALPDGEDRDVEMETPIATVGVREVWDSPDEPIVNLMMQSGEIRLVGVLSRNG